MLERDLIVGIGNIYYQTSYFGVRTENKDSLDVGRSYRALSYEIGLGGSVAYFAIQTRALDNKIGLIAKTGED